MGRHPFKGDSQGPYCVRCHRLHSDHIHNYEAKKQANAAAEAIVSGNLKILLKYLKAGTPIETAVSRCEKSMLSQLAKFELVEVARRD